MNGSNGNINGSGYKNPISLVNRIFNIAPSQWSRVSECWLITFFFKIGSAIGWTILTAAFVSRFGITFLPTLFVVNAVLIMVSTFYFERLITRIKREVLMILMVLLGGICLFFASFMYKDSPLAFFALVIFAESIFLAQFNVFIPILVGDRFTPLESQKTFPFIESAETIGGIIGGVGVGLLASNFPIQWFLYIWIGLLSCVIFVFIISSYLTGGLPPLPVRNNREPQNKTKDQIKVVFRSIKQMPFLKGLVVVILLQWIFMNILEFQYTKAIEQSITRKNEPTIAKVLDSNNLKANVLDSSATLPASNQQNMNRALTIDEEAKLTQKLGTYKGLFHGAALIVQIIVASRLITALGIVGSLLLHPVLMLMSIVGMFLKFGFYSSFISKMGFETTNVVHKNAYFSSHYAFPKSIRDQAAEFLEGIVRPMGTVVGMLFILGLQFLFAGKELSMWIHIIMFVVMAGILIETIRLQPKYTRITRDQLFSSLPYPEKLNAIEILSQNGHKNVSKILVDKLNQTAKEDSEEDVVVRMKLLSALGQLRDYETLPEILEALYDKNVEIRLEAAHALMNFHDIGERFYSQAFSRHRMVETLKDVFRTETSANVRSAIIRVFSLIRQPDVVSFLLEMLKTNSAQVRADCIYTLGLFKDPNAAYYVLPFLDDSDSTVRASVLVALWRFPKYSASLQNKLERMIKSENQAEVKAAIFAAGEIGVNKKRLLAEFLHNENDEIQLEAAFALTKLGDPVGSHSLLQKLLFLPKERFENLRRFFNRLAPNAKKTAEQVLIIYISNYIKEIMKKYRDKELKEIDLEVLERLRRLYRILDQHDELFEIENAIKKQSLTLV